MIDRARIKGLRRRAVKIGWDAAGCKREDPRRCDRLTAQERMLRDKAFELTFDVPRLTRELLKTRLDEIRWTAELERIMEAKAEENDDAESALEHGREARALEYLATVIAWRQRRDEARDLAEMGITGTTGEAGR